MSNCGVNPARTSYTSIERSTSTLSSTSSLSSRQFAYSPTQEQDLCRAHRPSYVANSPFQSSHGGRHYVNVCQDSFPPHRVHRRCSTSRESSVSDSEISATSSAASISALSESSELRALFPTVYEHPDDEEQWQAPADHRYNQLKVKPGSRMSQKTRQILYRPHHFESDSSSSLAESTDSLSTQGNNKHRELEHYNKLKLNLDNISENKRAIFGLKILYRDPPRGYRNLPSSPSPTRSLLYQRRPRGIFHQKSVDDAKLRTRYWSEGHSNKIHSVAPEPIRSKSLTWKQEDVSPVHHHLLDAGTPTHSTPVYRTRSLSDTQSYDVLMQDKELKKSKRNSSKSADNLSTGVVHPTARRSFSDGAHVQQGDFQSRKRLLTDPSSLIGRTKHTTSKTATSLDNGSYGTPDRRLSVLDKDRASGSINFIMSPIILKYEGEELEYHSKEHNFAIRIPKAALKKKGAVEVQIGLAIHGPFTFPEQSQIVSPILWLCSIPATKFRKPIHVTLPHCITDACPGYLERRKQLDEGLMLQFTSASLKSGSTSGKSRKHQFEFHPMDGEEFFSEMCGSLSTKQLCPLCIVASTGRGQQLAREIALHAGYCIVPVIPAAISGRQWTIHFCLTFCLYSCIQSLRSYFNEFTFQLMPPNLLKFSTPCLAVPGGDHVMWEDGMMTEQPELEIRFPRELPESGWKLFLQSERKMLSSVISFSPCHRADLTLSSSSSSSSSSTSSPPPMFTIAVDGTNATSPAVTCVSFVGSEDPVTVKLTLPLTDP